MNGKADILEMLLTDKQLHHVVEVWLEDHSINRTTSWIFLRKEVKNACENGMAGFLGDHLKVTLTIKVDDEEMEIRLFIKCLPMDNKPKAEFIDESNFFRREMMLYKIFEEMGGCDGVDCWRPKAYICNEQIVVMPDLSAEGYTTVPKHLYFDYDHVIAALSSIARFHATLTNYDSNKRRNGLENHTIGQQYGHILEDKQFQDSPFIRSAAKLTANFVKEFSTKFKNLQGPDLENQLAKLYIEACGSMREYKETLNIVVHRDLWANNVMFSYNKGKPRALVIDFQCALFGPPAFDVMTFFYLNTHIPSLKLYENEFITHYYDKYIEALDQETRKELQPDYSLETLLEWCEKGRMFGLLIAAVIFPYVQMDEESAKKTYDDPETFEHYTNVDRTYPVCEYARKNPAYRDKLLSVNEEFIERFVL